MGEEKMKKIGLLTLTVITIALVLSFGFTGDESKIARSSILDRKLAKEDVEEWFRLVAGAHPAVQDNDWESDANDKLIKWIKNQNEVIAKNDLAIFLNELVFELNDGHTKVQGHSMFWSNAWGGKPIFPLVLGYKSGEYRVFKTSKENKHLLGKVVESINGYSMAKLEQDYIRSFPGDSLGMSRNNLAQNIASILSQYETNLESFNLVLAGEEINLNAGQVKDIYAGTSHVPSFKVEGKTITLTLPSLAIYSTALQPFLNELTKGEFEEVVIDVRGNSGGNGGVAAYLLSKLTNKPIYNGTKRWFFSETYEELILANEFRKRNIPLWLGLHKITPLTWFNEVEVNEDEYVIKERGLMFHNEEQKAYKITVIVNEDTASAAVDLASYVQDNRLGRVVGTPTYAHASYYGEIAPVILENSQIHGQISSSFYIRPNGDDSKNGIIPERVTL